MFLKVIDQIPFNRGLSPTASHMLKCVNSLCGTEVIDNSPMYREGPIQNIYRTCIYNV